MRATAVSGALALLVSSALAGSAVAGGSPQVIAEAQGIAVSLTNLTPHMLNTPDLSSGDNAGSAGPAFPYSIFPYQTTGTGVVMRGGPASQGSVGRSYQIENGAASLPGFSLRFTADTNWDFDAAASLLLHQTKQYGVNKAKSAVKGPSPKTIAKKEAKDALVAAGAEDGMDEVLAAIKVVKELAKIFKALDPTFVMNIELSEYGGSSFYQNMCVSRSQSTPAPADVQILGPPGEVLQSNAGEYFVIAAGSVNKYSPGLVDVDVSPLCNYICAAWNGSYDYLNEFSQSDCEDATSGSTQLNNWTAFENQNTCLQQADAGPGGVAWVTPPDTTSSRYAPPTDGLTLGCGERQLFGYFPEAESICGTCPPVEADTPLGSWSESCDQESFSGSTLCADCATSTSSVRNSYSCMTCPSGHWTNDDGLLECAPVPGSWAQSCDFDSFEGTTLCATCATDASPDRTSASCQSCSSDEWSNANGQLVCDSSAQATVLPSFGRPPAWDASPPDDRAAHPAQYASASSTRLSNLSSGVNR